MNDDFKELIDFLGKKFENIDKKFDKIDEQFAEINKNFAAKDDLSNFATKDDLQDMARQNGILHEDTKHKLDLVIEALQMHADSNDRDMTVIRETIVRLERNDILLHADIDKLFMRVGALEGKG